MAVIWARPITPTEGRSFILRFPLVRRVMVDSTPTVFIVDDDPSVGKAWLRLIRSAKYHVELFASAEHFLDRSPHEGPACLVLDVRMPGLNGMELQEQLTSMGFITPIIFITGHGDIGMSVRAMKAGAVDFLPKPFEDQALLEAIHRAIDRSVEARREKSEIEEIQRRVRTLTDREREVMSLIVTGMLNKQIAYKLGISEKTIKVHRARVMHKTRCGSVAELVRLTGKIGINANK